MWKLLWRGAAHVLVGEDIEQEKEAGDIRGIAVSVKVYVFKCVCVREEQYCEYVKEVDMSCGCLCVV